MVTLSVLRCLSRNTVTGTVVPGVSAMTVCTSSSREPIGWLLTSRITSPGSMPALSAGPLGVTTATTAPVRSFNPNSSSASRGTGCTDTPIIPRVILPVRSCGSRLRTTLIGTAKPMPILPDCRESAIDGRVDADHFTAHVQERATRVARVDGGICLQHVDGATLADRERPLERADDADADGVREAERIADGHDPVAGLHLRRVAELGLRQRVVGFFGQLDERAVGQRVAAHHAGAVPEVVFLAVQRDFDLVGALHHVVVGEDEALLAR